MKIILDINEYNPGTGLSLKWEGDYKIKVDIEDGEVILSANNAGLLALANHLAALSQNQVPAGTHIHLDQYNSLEEDSSEIVIQKIE